MADRVPLSITYPFVTHEGMSDDRRLELLDLMYELGQGGGVIEITRGGHGVKRGRHPIAPGEFWCYGPGYRGGRVMPFSSDADD